MNPAASVTITTSGQPTPSTYATDLASAVGLLRVTVQPTSSSAINEVDAGPNASFVTSAQPLSTINATELAPTAGLTFPVMALPTSSSVVYGVDAALNASVATSAQPLPATVVSSCNPSGRGAKRRRGCSQKGTRKSRRTSMKCVAGVVNDDAPCALCRGSWRF
jgi:hypothetical protein